jgi:nucleotide-binding universal stress UspA family protein
MTQAFRRVLAATDLEATSDAALRYASDIARASHAALGVVVALPVGLRKLTAADAEGRLCDHMRAVTERERHAFHAFVDEGPAAEVIMSRAEEFDADLIVTGSHGPASRERPERLGSVALEVVREAGCSVLVARNLAKEGPVLVALDLGKSSVPVLRTGAAFASATGASALSVMHAADVDSPDVLVALTAFFSGSPPPGPDAEAIVGLARAALEAEVAAAGLKADVLVVRGDPKRAVINRAESLGASTIVVGATTHPTLAKLGLGSVAEAAVRRSEATVLVVRTAPQRPA